MAERKRKKKEEEKVEKEEKEEKAARGVDVFVGRLIATWVLSVIHSDYRSQHPSPSPSPHLPHLSLAAAAAAVVVVWVAMARVVVAGATSTTDVDGPLRYNVLEEVKHGTIIGDLTLDAGLRRRYTSEVLAALEFRIMSSPPLPFVVDLKTGVIRTGGVIDRDSLMQCKDKNLCEVTLDVTVRPTQFFQIIKVTIQVDDINDNAPYFRDQRMTISIRESAAIGTSFSLPLASDLDSPTFGVQAYELTTETESLGLSVMVRGGGLLEARLIVQQELDRETRDNYRLQLVAYDGGRPPKSASLDITVHVLDSNDHSPVFDRPSYATNLTENTAVGTVITRVSASDRDIGVNADVIYGFSQQTQTMYGHLFAINNKTGEISVVGEVDYEQSSVYQLAVIAEDRGPDSMPSDAAVVIRVQDVNDNIPTIVVSTLTARKTDTAEVSENLAPGTFVAHISVLDRDSGDNGRVSCNISDPVFSLVERYPTELQVLTSVTLDRETKDHYDVWIVCWDGGLPPLVARKLLPVRILDANDQTPRFTSSTYSGRVVENSQLDEPIIHVKATDADLGTNADLHYVLSPGVISSFDVNSDGAIVAKSPIDREQFSSFSFTVLAIDHGTPTLTGTALVLIIVDDVNDELPVFSRSSYSFSVAENEPEGTAVGKVSAEDLDVPPQNTVRYSFPGGHLTLSKFAIEPETGDVITTASLDRETESVYRFIVLATDRGEPPLTGTATVTVYVQDRNDHDPTFTFPTSSNNTVHISNAVPLGHVVTQVVALDPDLDKNGRLTYQLQAGNENGAFTVDPQRGLVTLNVRLNHIDFHDFHLIFVASDGGSPRRSTQGLLRVHVNSSIVYVPPPSSSDYVDPDESAGLNLVIVVLLVCGSAVAVVTLSILIVVVWRRSYRRKKSQRYKCRMEALRALTAKELVGSATCGEITPLTTPVTPFNGRTQRQTNNGALHANGSGSRPPCGSLYQTKALASDQLASDAEPDAASFLPSGQASTADSGNGHSEEEEGERLKGTPCGGGGGGRGGEGGGGGSRPMTMTRTGDFRFDLPPPPPPLLTHYGAPSRTLQGVAGPSRTQGVGGPNRTCGVVGPSRTQGLGSPVHRVAPTQSNSSTPCSSSYSKPSRSNASSSRLPSFTPSPELSRGVRKFFHADPTASFSASVPQPHPPPTATPHCLSSWSTTQLQPCAVIRDDAALPHAATNFDNDVIV